MAATANCKDSLFKVKQLSGFKTSMVFYLLVVFWNSYSFKKLPSWMTAVAKILPILILIRFVASQRNNSIQNLSSSQFCRSVFLGLCFSLLGDVSLVYDENILFFFVGLICFAVGHVMYVLAFGWRPFGKTTFVFFAVLAVWFYRYLWWNGLNEHGLGMQVGVMCYALILSTMNWRCWARLSLQDFRDGRWYEFLGCIGSAFFCLSDSLLSINMFVGAFPYSNYVIMVTYYVGQLGISLSVVDGPDKYED